MLVCLFWQVIAMFLDCSIGSDCGDVFEEWLRMTKLGSASPDGLPPSLVSAAPPSLSPASMVVLPQSILHTKATVSFPNRESDLRNLPA